MLTRRARRQGITEEIARIVDGSDNPNMELQKLAKTLDNHDTKKVFEELEDPYSGFNMTREGSEYTGKYWEAWMAVTKWVEPSQICALS